MNYDLMHYIYAFLLWISFLCAYLLYNKSNFSHTVSAWIIRTGKPWYFLKVTNPWKTAIQAWKIRPIIHIWTTLFFMTKNYVLFKYLLYVRRLYLWPYYMFRTYYNRMFVIVGLLWSWNGKIIMNDETFFGKRAITICRREREFHIE